jgi:hypothetical protein
MTEKKQKMAEKKMVPRRPHQKLSGSDNQQPLEKKIVKKTKD